MNKHVYAGLCLSFVVVSIIGLPWSVLFWSYCCLIILATVLIVVDFRRIKGGRKLEDKTLPS